MSDGAGPRVIKADVVVFGAGVAGLSAAHELAERNFKVVVIDPDIRDGAFYGTTPDDDNPGLGGMARTQWCYLHNQAAVPHPAQAPVPPSGTSPTRPRPFRAFVLRWHLVDEIETAIDRDTHRDIDLKATIAQVRAELADPSLYVTIRTTPRVLDCREYDLLRQRFEQRLDEYVADPALRQEVRRLFPADAAAYATTANLQWAAIKSLVSAVLTKDQVGLLHARYSDDLVTYVLLRRLLTNDDPAIMSRVEHQIVPADVAPAGSATIVANVFALPGEHGFRFFPSFYRHLFDTMRRTPLMQPRTRDDELEFVRAERGTVLDNLVPADSLVLAGDAETPSIRIRRRQGFSPEKLRELVRGLMREGRYTERDLTRLTAKFLQYLTSSRQRRETEYEQQSWYEFVEADRLSPIAQRLTEMIPGVLVGLQASEADARTQGTIALQCLLDQFGDGSTSDRLLNGPSDNAWFGHWHRYLCAQDVRFLRGTLTGFEPLERRVVPQVEVGGRPVVFEPSRHMDRVLYVLALPMTSAVELAERFLPVAEACGHLDSSRDFADLLSFAGMSSRDIERDLRLPTPRGALRHLSGIQYYFAQELRLWRAHTQYLDAHAGLTAIAQPQFWLDMRNVLTGYRSVLSVDIGTWSQPMRNGRPVPGTSPNRLDYPWHQSPGEVADLVWRQITYAHRGDVAELRTPLPVPVAYHLDDSLVLEPPAGGGEPVVAGNRSPYLVNLTRRFRRRPGLHHRPCRETEWKAVIRYRVAAEQYVLAGTHMQTFTRITSMESACESARHAVNALLRMLQIPGEPCGIWDPEDHEPDTFDLAKDLDDRLCSQRARHAGEGLTTLDEWHVVMSPRCEDA